MYGDLIDLFEQSAANRTPIRQIVGEDPVEFVETFVRNYPGVTGSTGSANG
jgi:DNA-binding ferritin-like protein (Dps family)